MTSQSSGGSGSGLPGVTTDGKIPGGEVIAGDLTAGDPNAASAPSEAHIWGSLFSNDSPGNHVDGDDVLTVKQRSPLAANSDSFALTVKRQSALNGFDFTGPTAYITDVTASAQPVLQAEKQGVIQFQVDGDGVQVHGKFKTGASVTHTASVLSGKCVPIYDESGTLLGYMPLYN